ncbi:Rieske 2Fe-2S domain-containing protein [Kribbella qitaiheensis]|uniref:Cytochrome bc1 complex Rieske iron-sulfur subunit n=1 Tax=Kribbella qitaiheensis TaxID=1544730 RepID=A0A7G6X2I2_9ACTN|nr:Rieske (2Fe-2S) protein [Kribbella qitaiheensis]QNE20447.1 Rieske 2Fe-2S domain-containing protein [Kribbella qitaiheensis]
MSKSEKAVERRTVLLAGGAAATVVLGGCVVQRAPVATPAPQASSAPATQPAPTAPGTQPATSAPEQPSQPAPNALAQVADIPAGGGVILKDKNVVLTKDQSGKVSAFSAICTHQGCSVTAVEGGTINCPCHGSKFNATSGEPVAGPARKALPAIAFQQRDGAIFQA